MPYLITEYILLALIALLCVAMVRARRRRK